MTTKKSKIDDKIIKSLDLEVPSQSNDITVYQENIPSANVGTHLQVAETDFGNARSTLTKLLKHGEDAVKGILDVAEDSDSPRAYEVVGQLIKNTAEVSQRLIEINTQMQTIRLKEKKLRTQSSNTVNQHQHNTLYVGTAEELLKLVNPHKQQSEIRRPKADDTILDVDYEEV